MNRQPSDADRRKTLTYLGLATSLGVLVVLAGCTDDEETDDGTPGPY